MKNSGAIGMSGFLYGMVVVLTAAAMAGLAQQGTTAAKPETVKQSAPAAAPKPPERGVRKLKWCEVLEVEPDPAVVTDAAFREAIKKTG